MKNSKPIWALGALLAAFVIASVWSHGGGYLFGEADLFLIDHNASHRSELAQILCPHITDAEYYCAREITHAVEHFDAVIIDGFSKAGHTHFLSFHTYLFLVCISVGLFVLFRKFGLGDWISILLIALFLTAPPIFMAGVYVRPGHAHAAFWFMALVLAIVHHSGKRASDLAIGAFGFLLCWADRQGLFVACSICILLAIHKAPFLVRILAALGLAILLNFVWTFWIGPELVARYSGFKTNQSYQSAPFFGLAAHFWSKGWDGSLIALDSFRLLLGNLSRGVCFGMLVMAITLAGNKRLLFAFGFLLVAALDILVLYHQHMLGAPDVIMSYYHIVPTLALLLLSVGLALPWLKARSRWACLAVSILILGNLAALPEHRRALRSGHMIGYIAGAPVLRDALNQISKLPQAQSANHFDTRLSSSYTGFEHIMINPMTRPGLTLDEFVRSSSYLNWRLSEKGAPFKQ